MTTRIKWKEKRTYASNVKRFFLKHFYFKWLTYGTGWKNNCYWSPYFVYVNDNCVIDYFKRFVRWPVLNSVKKETGSRLKNYCKLTWLLFCSVPVWNSFPRAVPMPDNNNCRHSGDGRQKQNTFTGNSILRSTFVDFDYVSACVHFNRKITGTFWSHVNTISDPGNSRRDLGNTWVKFLRTRVT